MELLERAAQLEQLDTLLGEASAWRGRLVLLGGEAGVGTSPQHPGNTCQAFWRQVG